MLNAPAIIKFLKLSHFGRLSSGLILLFSDIFGQVIQFRLATTAARNDQLPILVTHRPLVAIT
ncbi:MAG: hypothetical protein ACK56I_31210, partial [bacterium]